MTDFHFDHFGTKSSHILMRDLTPLWKCRLNMYAVWRPMDGKSCKKISSPIEVYWKTTLWKKTKQLSDLTPANTSLVRYGLSHSFQVILGERDRETDSYPHWLTICFWQVVKWAVSRWDLPLLIIKIRTFMMKVKMLIEASKLDFGNQWMMSRWLCPPSVCGFI